MILYRDSIDAIEPAQLAGGFFEGWPNPPAPATHLRILKGSYAVILALDAAVDEAQPPVIGFINAISDGTLAAFIPLLEVLPAYRGGGIGTALVERMLEKLRQFYAVDLICDPDLNDFYRRFGMHPYNAMTRRQYERQSGA
ncbi:MAG: GNAT family N-acetyltransferase [Aggregatilineales bacterium]